MVDGALHAVVSGGTALGIVAASGGTATAAATPVLALSAARLAETAYGSGVVLYSFSNPAPQPRYTEANFRKNLENAKPIPKGMKDPEAHHIVPKDFADHPVIQNNNINVHDARKWGTWLSRASHRGAGQGVHSLGYNDMWRNWLNRNPHANLQQIEDFARQMATQFGIGWP